MKNKLIITATLIIIFVVLLVTVNSSGSDASIKIGTIIPQTGFGAYWGSPVLKGIKLAEKDLGSEYPDKNIRVLTEDSQSDPTKGVSAAQKLINIDKIDALYSEFSGISSAISPVAKNAGKVLVYSTFNQKISEDNQTSVKTFISFEVACEKLASYLNDKNKKVLIISAISDSAPYCANALGKALPEKNVKVIEGFTGKDFRTLLLQNKEFSPDYIIPIMYEDGAYALIKQNYELGLGYHFYCYKQDCVTEKLLSELPQAATENILYFEASVDTTFEKRMQSEYPGISNDDIQAAANAYQSIYAVGSALAECKDKDSRCVIDNLSNRSNLGRTGYKGAYFKDRVLHSELNLSIVHAGKGQLIK